MNNITDTKPRSHSHTRRAIGLMLCLLAGIVNAPASAAVFNVFVDTASFSGVEAVIAFDFINGNVVADNEVLISAFDTDGSLGEITLDGSASGTLIPGPAMLSDDSFFSSLTQQITLGDFFSFTIDVSTNGPFQASPDAFSMFLLDPDLLPLVTTSDPSGANALMAIDITAFALTPEAFEATGINVSVQPIPVPGAIVMLLSGLLTLARPRFPRQPDL